MTNKTVIILRGLPGSGKNWHVDNVLKSDFPLMEVCSADDYFTDSNGNYNWNPRFIGAAHGSCREKFRSAIEKNVPCVVVNNTNTMVKEMTYYVQNAQNLGYQIRFIHLKISPELSFKRNTHNVPEAAIQAMHTRFQDIPSHWGQEHVIAAG